jgi:hypothetical protein
MFTDYMFTDYICGSELTNTANCFVSAGVPLYLELDLIHLDHRTLIAVEIHVPQVLVAIARGNVFCYIVNLIMFYSATIIELLYDNDGFDSFYSL